MTFQDAIKIVCESLEQTGTTLSPGSYDGLIVKKLESSNTLDEGRTTNQTHIAITGEQMDIFPYLRADGYFSGNDNDLKKYFVARVPITILESNCNYLSADTGALLFSDGKLETKACVLRSKRANAADQIQMSLIRFDGEAFVGFRRALHTGDYLVILKEQNRLYYHALGIKAYSASEELRRLNNRFFKLSANTVVDAANDFTEHEKIVTAERRQADYICDRVPRANKTNPLNLIIYGAPGTGKTYSTAEYAVAAVEGRAIRKDISAAERKALKEQYRALARNGQIVFTTFHQSYSYEDFIQGLRPDSENGVLDFVPVDGVFKQLADTAMHDPANNYAIIIDEINRGNISKVFGELITLIEEDKRWGEENQLSVFLPSGEEFAVPNNLYIIGTMNSADKSIALIDTALRRRFDFEEVAPDPELIEDETLKKVLISLNTLLRKQLDSSDLLIGHAYFIDKTSADLPAILNRNIIPLLYEYFYDQEKKVKDALAKALEGTSVTFDENSRGRIKVK